MIEQISTLVELLDLLSLDHRIVLREGDQPIRKLKSLQQTGLAGKNDDLIVAMSPLEPSELYRVFAAVSLRPDLLNANQISRLHEFLLDDSSAALQTAIARQLRLATHPTAVEKLFDVIIRCPDPHLRSVLAYAIADNKGSDWQGKCHQLQSVLSKHTCHRENVDCAALVTAVKPKATDLSQDRFLLTDHLIKQANNLTEDVERLTGILAGLIIESVGHSIFRASQRVSEYVNASNTISPTLALLQSEINSSTLSVERKAYLEETYSEPLQEAHDEIRLIWKSSLSNVDRSLRSRRWLGVLGIIVGLIILLSTVPIIVLELQGGFILALIGILIFSAAIVYGGPIRDFKQVTKELSTANVVYMAYMQRALEISTSFKHQFLNNQLSQESLIISNDLISKAMNDSIKALRVEGETTLDDILAKLGN